MTTRTAAIVLAALLALTGCGKEPGGTVTEKEHEAAHSKQSCSTSNGKRTCKTKRVAECWELEWKRADGSEGEKCVTRTVYDRYQVGQQYRP